MQAAASARFRRRILIFPSRLYCFLLLFFLARPLLLGRRSWGVGYNRKRARHEPHAELAEGVRAHARWQSAAGSAGCITARSDAAFTGLVARDRQAWRVRGVGSGGHAALPRDAGADGPLGLRRGTRGGKPGGSEAEAVAAACRVRVERARGGRVRVRASSRAGFRAGGFLTTSYDL